jgi:N-acetylglucosamine-6-phosphate deacetylase
VSETAVLADRAVVDGEVVGPVTLTVADGLLTDVGPPRAVAALRAATVVPGLLDVHTHGGAGVQVSAGADADLERLALFYARHGVTGFLATVGGSREHILDGIAAVRAHLAGGPFRGARILGVHVEGPFISPCALGAFRPESVQAPDPQFLREMLTAADGHLRLMTVAPEDSVDVIALAVENGVVCSAGHSVASAEQTTRAVDAGVRSVSHLFNGMAAFHHREPGLLGVALTDDRLVCELIADGVHVHPTAVRLAVRAKGVDRIALISDSIAATGLPDGEYELEEVRVTVTGDEVRLADGTLAGSTLTLDRAVSNLARWAGLPLTDAVRAATTTPARLLGLEAKHGTIAVGRSADFAAFDGEHRLLWTMVAGEVHPA